MPKSLHPLLLMLAIAVAYALSGRLGLLLAIPPGYATAIFPPAGIALAALLAFGRGVWPGIWIGSFAMNLSVSAAPFSPWGLFIAAGVATGSTLQASVGAALLRRYCPQPLVLADERTLLRFTVLAAVLATTLAASIGVGTLMLAGAIGVEAAPISWLTWWVGDGIGVLLIAPISLMAFGQPRAFWRPQLTSVAPWLICALALVLTMFVASSRWENQRLRAEFRTEASHVAEMLRAELAHSEESVYAVERLFAASSEVDRDEFRAFVARILAQQPAVNIIEWVPQVEAGGVEAHLQRLRRLRQVEHTLWQPDNAGEPVPVEPRDVYFPVSLIEPQALHGGMLGLDLGFETVRREALQAALRSPELQVSERINLLQDGSAAVFALLGVRRTGAATSVDAVAAVINLHATVQRALSQANSEGLAISLLDLSADAKRQLLFRNDQVDAADPRFQWQTEHRFGGREWRISIAGNPQYVAARRSWQGWLVLVGGLVVTAMLGALLLLASGRADRIEGVVEQRTRALRRSERIHEAVTQASPDAILLADQQGAVIAANRAAETLFSASAEALVGRNLSALITLPDRSDPALSAAGSVLRRETLALCKRSGPIPVEATLTVVSLDDEQVTSCLLRDLRVRDELARMKNEFIAVVSHELRTPLTSIRGALGLLAGGAGGTLPERANTLLQMSVQNGERLARLIDDLLDFEKLEAGGVHMALLRQPLPPILQQALDEIAGYAVQPRVQLRSAIAEDLPPVRVAADRLIQVLNNLLSNAIKFSPAEAVVELRAQRTADGLRIEVRDHGSGIATEQHDQVFSTFWQADSSAQRRHSGTGLGLAISKRLVERMGGRIGFESVPNQGSCFWIELPAAEADDADD